MNPDDRRQRWFRASQVVALAVSLGGIVATLAGFQEVGPSVAVTGVAIAMLVEWLRIGAL